MSEIEKIEGDKSIATFEHDGFLFFKKEFVNVAMCTSVTEIIKESSDSKMKKIMSILKKSFSSRGWSLNTDRICKVYFNDGRILTIKESFDEIKKLEKA